MVRLAVIHRNKNCLLFIFIYSAAFALFLLLLPVTLPLFIAIFLAKLISPVLRFLQSKLRLGIKAGVYTAVPAAMMFLFLLFAFGMILLVHELSELTQTGAYFSLEDLTPNAKTFLERIITAFPDPAALFRKGSSEIMTVMLPAAGKVLRVLLSLPAILLLPVLTGIAACKLLLNREKIRSFFSEILGAERCYALQRSLRSRSRLSESLLVSYAVIYFVTFCEAFIILQLLELPYPTFTSVLITLSDVLPVFGPGLVFIPLAVYRWLCGMPVQAWGLLFGWLIMLVNRQILETKLISGITKTPVWIILVSVYIGLIFGVFWPVPYVLVYFPLCEVLNDAGFNVKFTV